VYQTTNPMSIKTYTVYILKCSDGTYYTGMTSNLSQRMEQHEFGAFEKAYTFSRRPVSLQFIAEFIYVYDAIEFEKKIKRWSGQKKAALIAQNIDKLKELASCRNITRYVNSAG
jgi:putative endonuclease